MMWSWILIIIFSLCLLYIFLFSLGQLHLTWLYKKSKITSPEQITQPLDWPTVCVQLPVYNERYVVERLIKAICAFDYPMEKFEVQILDDSDDMTSELIAHLVLEFKDEINIHHVQRADRKGFKAGALAYGLEKTSAEFIAIFDADFLPGADFLKRTIPSFATEIGVVQTRWGHINQNYDLLTELQAFGLDAHFTVEQGGRSHAGSFINFNGTGGVWRKQCILDAGGWSADTLTEDLDLSYRAQLKGWKFRYIEDCVAPAELPVIMPSIKAQQYRWNKGGAETARKNLWSVLKSSIPFKNKFHAFFHLLNSSVFITLFIAAVVSVPLLFIKNAYPQYDLIFDLGIVFILGFFSIAYFYAVAYRSLHPKGWIKRYFKIFPLFLLVSMGLSLHNGIAVFEGLIGRKSSFIRTPKFNTVNTFDSWKNNAYLNLKITPLSILEGLLTLYFLFGVIVGVMVNETGMIVFHTMLSIGFGLVFFFSLKPLKYA